MHRVLALRCHDLLFCLKSHVLYLLGEKLILFGGLLGHLTVIKLSHQVIELLVENYKHRLDRELALHVPVILNDVRFEDLVRKLSGFNHII